MENNKYRNLEEIAKGRSRYEEIENIEKGIRSLHRAIELAIFTDPNEYLNNYGDIYNQTGVHLRHILEYEGNDFSRWVSYNIMEMRKKLKSLLDEGIISGAEYVFFNSKLDEVAYQAIEMAVNGLFVGENNIMAKQLKYCEEKHTKKVEGGGWVERFLRGIIGRRREEVWRNESLINSCKRHYIHSYVKIVRNLFKHIYPQIGDINLKVDALITVWKAVEQADRYSSYRFSDYFSAIREYLKEEAKNIIEKYQEEISRKVEEYAKLANSQESN